MQATLEQFLTLHVFAFMLCFLRVGTIVMIMPGIGDTFVNTRIRLLMALAMSFVLFPLLVQFVPDPLPGTITLIMLMLFEFLVGLFLGTITRFFMAALDVAGMMVSFASSLSNAQLFNPGLASQGSLVGAFLTVTGVVVLFSTGLHHLIILGMMDSYTAFPIGQLPDTGSMAELMAKALSTIFTIGVQIGAPFMVVMLLLYMGMGILSRLMPQVQVFMIALPLQVFLALVLFSLVLSAMFMYWISEFQSAVSYLFGAMG